MSGSRRDRIEAYRMQIVLDLGYNALERLVILARQAEGLGTEMDPDSQEEMEKIVGRLQKLGNRLDKDNKTRMKEIAEEEDERIEHDGSGEEGDGDP